MNDDVQSELLEAEFRQILIAIKPHINHIDNHYHLESYRVWLERLSNAHFSEKAERNKYLLELANQIQDNVLEPPFTYNPPRGLLPRIKTFHRLQTEDDATRISDHFFQKDENQWPFVTSRPSLQESNKNLNKSKTNTWPQKRNKPIKTKLIRPFQKLGSVGQGEEKKSETSGSWYDLNESPSGTQGCGDTDQEDDENKSLGTQHLMEGLKTKEEFAKKYEEEKSKDSFNPEKFLAEENSNRKPTAQELEALKMRMKDLLEVKNALRDTHCLTQDRKKTLETLQAKLSEVEQQKAELQVLLESQKKKFLELDKVKSKEMNEFKEKFAHLRQKEVDYLKKYHNEEITSLEKSYSSKISEMQEKINSLKEEYEAKIKNLSDSNMTLLQEKEQKIHELQSEIKIKESQPVNQGNSDQILNLKKCLSRLDRILHRNEKDYTKKIEKLKEELDLKEVTSQVQLQAQKADLIVRTSAAKQEELRNALNSLECKYKQMVETVQMHALESKKRDERVIEELKGLLQKHNVLTA
ncbi:early endosome antigen 1-like [Tribolium madens]|uniref:early endosome antigen 1-like n=1 Tax=Tribolium madens TaxID=41895 RepID=UPI001CF75652|nr:early endosome antigen 1-like [Tribolium madens]